MRSDFGHKNGRQSKPNYQYALRCDNVHDTRIVWKNGIESTHRGIQRQIVPTEQWNTNNAGRGWKRNECEFWFFFRKFHFWNMDMDMDLDLEKCELFMKENFKFPFHSSFLSYWTWFLSKIKGTKCFNQFVIFLGINIEIRGMRAEQFISKHSAIRLHFDWFDWKSFAQVFWCAKLEFIA